MNKEQIIDKHLAEIKKLMMEENVGEINIHWKGTSIVVKFSKWINTSILTPNTKNA